MHGSLIHLQDISTRLLMPTCYTLEHLSFGIMDHHVAVQSTQTVEQHAAYFTDILSFSCMTFYMLI